MCDGVGGTQRPRQHRMHLAHIAFGQAVYSKPRHPSQPQHCLHRTNTCLLVTPAAQGMRGKHVVRALQRHRSTSCPKPHRCFARVRATMTTKTPRSMLRTDDASDMRHAPRQARTQEPAAIHWLWANQCEQLPLRLPRRRPSYPSCSPRCRHGLHGYHGVDVGPWLRNPTHSMGRALTAVAGPKLGLVGTCPAVA